MAARKMSKRSKRSTRRHTRKMRGGQQANTITLTGQLTSTGLGTFTSSDPTVKVTTGNQSLTVSTSSPISLTNISLSNGTGTMPISTDSPSGIQIMNAKGGRVRLPNYTRLLLGSNVKLSSAGASPSVFPLTINALSQANLGVTTLPATITISMMTQPSTSSVGSASTTSKK